MEAHKGEKPYKTAIREGTEELNGFFGSEEELDMEVTNNKILSICYDKYTTYIFKTKNIIKNYQNILVIIINLLKFKQRLL